VKVVFATPSLSGPTRPYIESLENSLPAVEAAGWEHSLAQEVGSPYISGARANLVKKFMASDADCILFIDYDLSWRPEDMVAVLQTPGDVVAGTYRYKQPEEAYMGTIHTDESGFPVLKNGCILAMSVPAGFLKITRKAVERFTAAYPELVYGKGEDAAIDMFNHGAIGGVWYGEDYAFCKRWMDLGGEILLVPDLNINHHTKDAVFVGNYHNYLCKQPGGNLCGM